MNKLELAVAVYRSLEDKSVHARVVKGALSEDVYFEYKSSLTNFGLLVSSNDGNFIVEFNLPTDKNALFALSMEDLLVAPSRLISPPKTFYLAEVDLFVLAKSDEIPDEIRNYFLVAKFASTLISIADHAMIDIPKAIFLHGEKLELSLCYTKEDLLYLDGLDKFVTDFVEAEIHKEQKSTIIKGVLLEMLKNNEIDRLTLSCLIRRFSEFLERVNANYQLYVSEFSFDKIKNKFESEKLELTIKLNKIISDIQNQLLAVPVALVLVGSQMEKTNSLTVKNISLWLGALIFGFLMSLLIRNQRSSLEAIKLEIESQWENIENKHKFVADRLSAHYLQLNKRYFSQKIFLMLISFIVAVSISASTVLLLSSSDLFSVFNNFLIYGAVGGLIYVLVCLFFKRLSEIKQYLKRLQS